MGKLPGLVEADGFQSLPMTTVHALRAGSHDVAHRDAFDRMLAAQCALDELVLVTRDPEFGAYGTTTLW